MLEGEETRNETTEKFEFWAQVRAQVEQDSARVPGDVVDYFASKEVRERIEKTIQTVDALSKLQTDLKKLKPDQEMFDVTGQMVQSYFSKAKLEERKKLVEKIERVEAALRSVFEGRDFDKLKKLNLDKPDANAA